MEQLLVCPFTLTPLRALSESELLRFHERIEAGHFYFRKGIPLNFLPKKAYTSLNQVYIFIEIDGTMLLQKQTAVVTKSHTEFPQRRLGKEVEMAFYQELMLSPEGSFQVQGQAETAISEKISDLEPVKQLPKTGRIFATLGTAQVDAVHNLLFGTSFQNHVHLDHEMSRLLAVAGKLKKHTTYVLCDKAQIPVESEGIDALLSFEFLSGLDKTTQESLFDSLRSTMNLNGVAFIINLEGKASHVENRFKSVKSKAAFTPWKKVKLPQLLFHNITLASPPKPTAFSGKTSWGSQLS